MSSGPGPPRLRNPARRAARRGGPPGCAAGGPCCGTRVRGSPGCGHGGELAGPDDEQSRSVRGATVACAARVHGGRLAGGRPSPACRPAGPPASPRPTRGSGRTPVRSGPSPARSCLSHLDMFGQPATSWSSASRPVPQQFAAWSVDCRFPNPMVLPPITSSPDARPDAPSLLRQGDLHSAPRRLQRHPSHVARAAARRQLVMATHGHPADLRRRAAQGTWPSSRPGTPGARLAAGGRRAAGRRQERPEPMTTPGSCSTSREGRAGHGRQPRHRPRHGRGDGGGGRRHRDRQPQARELRTSGRRDRCGHGSAAFPCGLSRRSLGGLRPSGRRGLRRIRSL